VPTRFAPVVRAELQELPRARRQRQRPELRQDVDLFERPVDPADLALEDRAGSPVDDRLPDSASPRQGAGDRGREVIAGRAAALEDLCCGTVIVIVWLSSAVRYCLVR
jgi:hypothetical protein